jgi:hypothetical protein
MTKTACGVAIPGCLLLSGCATYEMTYQAPGPAPDPAASYAIVHFETGRANLSGLICEALTARGITATIVADEQSAGPSQRLLRYESSWLWDVTWFLYMITIGIYDQPGESLQAASLMGRTTGARNTPRKVVEMTLVPMFGKRPPDAQVNTDSCTLPLVVAGDN